MVSDLTYDLRSGAPDALDQIVATTFANIAVDLIRDGISGSMIAIQKGCYAHSPLPDRARRAQSEFEKIYNTARYRPNYPSKLGEPLLQRSGCVSEAMGSPEPKAPFPSSKNRSTRAEVC